MICGEEVYRDSFGKWHHYREHEQTYDHNAKPESQWNKLPKAVQEKIFSEELKR
jgi:hypothetical protein